MGGGQDFAGGADEQHETVAAHIFQVCDIVAYGTVASDCTQLEREYDRLDTLLNSLGESMPYVVGRCPAHVESLRRMRELATRYKDVEVTSKAYLDGARLLGDGLGNIVRDTTATSSTFSHVSRRQNACRSISGSSGVSISTSSSSSTGVSSSRSSDGSGGSGGGTEVGDGICSSSQDVLGSPRVMENPDLDDASSKQAEEKGSLAADASQPAPVLAPPPPAVPGSSLLSENAHAGGQVPSDDSAEGSEDTGSETSSLLRTVSIDRACFPSSGSNSSSNKGGGCSVGTNSSSSKKGWNKKLAGRRWDSVNIRSSSSSSSSSSGRRDAARASTHAVCNIALREALQSNAASTREALQMAVQRMAYVAAMLEATAAAHRAVARDLDVIVAKAADVLMDPARGFGDIGFGMQQAAPLLGGAAAGSLGFLILRGLAGMLAAVALFSLGAVGASEYTQAHIIPHIQTAFARLHQEGSQVASLIESKAAALDSVSGDLLACCTLLQMLLEIPADGSFLCGKLLEEKMQLVGASLSTLVARCDHCRQRLTPFLALSLGPQPLALSHRGQRHDPSQKQRHGSHHQPCHQQKKLQQPQQQQQSWRYSLIGPLACSSSRRGIGFSGSSGGDGGTMGLEGIPKEDTSGNGHEQHQHQHQHQHEHQQQQQQQQQQRCGARRRRNPSYLTEQLLGPQWSN